MESKKKIINQSKVIYLPWWTFIIIFLGLSSWLLYLRWHGYIWLTWTGFEGKTIWDFLELLIIPGSLAAVALILEKVERKADRENVKDTQQEAALQNYIDTMTRFILENRIKVSTPGEEVSMIAQVKTNTTLQRLDLGRRNILVKFLGDVGLVSGKNDNEPVIKLVEANLEHAKLIGINFENAYLHRTKLNSSKLSGAILKGAHMLESVLDGASLWGSNLISADLESASLKGVNLQYANLTGANLIYADLSSSNLEHATLKEVNLKNAIFTDAIMPDGKIYNPLIHTQEMLTGIEDDEIND
jgi:hypothetical protein